MQEESRKRIRHPLRTQRAEGAPGVGRAIGPNLDRSRTANYVVAVTFGDVERRDAVVADERETLEAVLDDLRDLIRMSVEGLTEEEARRRLLPSETTILGIIQHTAAVERFFFQRTLEGLEPNLISGRSDATDSSWDVHICASIESALRDHEEACASSRSAASRRDLAHVTPHNEKRGPLTLRWIYAT